ncbi:MAG: tetratricopeptide repeat protein [Chthoniobacterales bacterium]
MTPRNFFAELKRRNVYKVAVAYVVVAWLLLQAASIFFPAFEAPPWVMKVFIIVILLGFPAALVLSWAFEITPGGIKLESEVDPNESITPRTGRRIVGITIALAVIAAGLMTFQILRPKSSAVVNIPAVRPTSTPSEPAIESKSIAVLPFDNLSRDPDNAYFSEGIQDEILTRLAKIGDFKVISRTSTERYKSAPENLREIARQLGVAHILEGSVQKAGEQVRVNVQLINALNDAHLWADTYDRKLTDIFAVESEIAKTVAETLRVKLNGRAEKELASRPTENPEAHQLYLKGRYFWNKRSTENLKKAIEYFQQAIDLDPNYALAYAGLGDAHSILPIYAGTPPKDDIPKALAAAHKAVVLDDSLAEAHTSLANALVMNVQLPQSEPEFRRAIELNPNYATAHQWYGECLFGEGRYPEALAELVRAQELDPLSPIINASLGMVLGGVGQTERAIDQLHKTLDLDPDLIAAHSMLGQILEREGKLSEAMAEYDKVRQLGSTPSNYAMRAYACVKAGRTAEARKILEDLTNASRQRYVGSYSLAVVHLALGDNEEGLRLLEKSFDERDILLQGMFGSIKTDKRLDPLRGDPRFQKLEARFMSGESK